MNTGDRIKLRRKQLGISADVLAEKIGVSRSTMFRYESGDIEKVPLDYLGSLSKALMTTPHYLMGWTDDPDYQIPEAATLTEHSQEQNTPAIHRGTEYDKLTETNKSIVNQLIVSLLASQSDD